MGVNTPTRLDRVDNVPWRWLPPVLGFWGLWALTLLMWHRLLQLTCRIQWEGTEHLQRARDGVSAQSYIYCGWHDTLTPYTVSLQRVPRPYVLLSNHAWFMWPIHFLSYRMGVDILIPVLDGQDARAASHDLVELLKQGYSTMMTPDGPSGPPRVLKRGVLLIAAKSGTPILPLRIETQAAWTWEWSWDRKRIPLPFSRIKVRYMEPIVVTRAKLKEAEAALLARLG